VQEKFQRAFRRLFRRCHRPLGRDRRFSSAGDVSLTGAFHVEDVDAYTSTPGGHELGRRRMQQRGSDASSVNYFERPRASSTQLTPVSVHRQQSPPTSRPAPPTSSGTHLTVPSTTRYRPVKTEDAVDEAVQLADL